MRGPHTRCIVATHPSLPCSFTGTLPLILITTSVITVISGQKSSKSYHHGHFSTYRIALKSFRQPSPSSDPRVPASTSLDLEVKAMVSGRLCRKTHEKHHSIGRTWRPFRTCLSGSPPIWSFSSVPRCADVRVGKRAAEIGLIHDVFRRTSDDLFGEVKSTEVKSTLGVYLWCVENIAFQVFEV